MLNEHLAASAPAITEEQLAKLGGGIVAYVKPIRSEELSRLFPQAPEIQPGLQLFALLNADGTPILVPIAATRLWQTPCSMNCRW